MAEKTRRDDEARGHSMAAVWCVRGVLFALATLLIACALWWLGGAGLDLDAMSALWGDAQLGDSTRAILLRHLGASAALVAMAWGIWAGLSRRRVATQRRVQLTARGAVMLESLIAIPVLLLLICGLMQLTLNNITMMMVNLATFEGARVAWIWEAEACPNCNASQRASEYARVQVAAVLAPVADASGAVSPSVGGDRFERLRAAMVASQIPFAAGDGSGASGDAMANRVIGPGSNSLSVSRALGAQPYSVRSARQMTIAYESTRTTVRSNSSDEITFELTYRHRCTVPFVPQVFGDYGRIGQRRGYFMTMERTYTQKRLPRANRASPLIDDDPPTPLIQ